MNNIDVLTECYLLSGLNEVNDFNWCERKFWDEIAKTNRVLLWLKESEKSWLLNYRLWYKWNRDFVFQQKIFMFNLTQYLLGI